MKNMVHVQALNLEVVDVEEVFDECGDYKALANWIGGEVI